MSPDLSAKDASIRDLLPRLRAVFSPSTIAPVDHWPGDECAVGFADPADLQVLAYVSTHGLLPGRYAVHLEQPAASGGELPYTPGSEYPNVGFDELVKIVGEHLQLRR